jgi:predicted O-methyltransferase YrrM
MPNLTRALRNRLKDGLHTIFRLGQKAGWDLLPRHFYSGIPDLRQLQNTDRWRRPMSMIGVDGIDPEVQMQFLRKCCAPHAERLRVGGIHDYACRENGGDGYGSVEADFLYCFIATQRPKKIIQVGCGVSSAVILLAAKDVGYAPEVVCIEPFSNAYLRDAAAQRQIELVQQKAQDVGAGALSNLDTGDLLFVDSTHAVRPGSEVNWIVLEVLPRLKPGCFVHFHDIYFPYDYQPSLFDTLFFSAESTLLHAFLINNPRFSIAISLSMLHHCRPQDTQQLLPNYQPAAMKEGLYAASGAAGQFPSATYLSVH